MKMHDVIDSDRQNALISLFMGIVHFPHRRTLTGEVYKLDILACIRIR
jgi:hypothetical protein